MSTTVFINPSRFAVAGGFAPDDETGLYQWLNGDDIGLADGTAMATWPDSSGNGRIAEATGTIKPLCKTNILNGHPVARFDGIDDVMTLGDYSALTAGEVFIVVKVANEPAASNKEGLWGVGSAGSPALYAYSDGNIYENWGSTARYTVGNPTPSLAAWRIYHIYSAPNDWQAFFDGATFGANQTTHTVGFPVITSLGYNNGASFLDGDVAEYIFYDHKLSGGVRTSVVGYLQTKYAI